MNNHNHEYIDLCKGVKLITNTYENSFIYIMMLIPISKLENIVFSRAVVSAIQMNIRNELSIDKIIDFAYHMPTLFPNGILVYAIMIIVYGQLMYSQGHNAAMNKYQKIPKYMDFRGNMRNILLVFMILFVKDIESVV